MLDYYRTNQPFVIILIIFTALVIWIPYFIDPDFLLRGLNFQEQPLNLMGLISTWNPKLVLSLSLILWLFIAFLISFINLNQQLIDKRNYLPALFFLLSLSWIPGLKICINSLVGLIFISFVFNILLSSYTKKNDLSPFFRSGILIALSSLFNVHFSAFLIILWIAIILFQRSSWRSFLASVIGFIVPWGFYYGIFYLINGSVKELNQLIHILLVSNRSIEDINILQVVLIGLNILIILFSSFHFVRKRSQMKIRQKRFYYLFLWTFVIILFQYLLCPCHKASMLMVITIPLSFLFSHYFGLIKSNWKGNLIFSIYFLSMVVAQYLFVFVDI